MVDLWKYLDRQLLGFQDSAERPELQRAVAPREGSRWQTPGEFRYASASSSLISPAGPMLTPSLSRKVRRLILVARRSCGLRPV